MLATQYAEALQKKFDTHRPRYEFAVESGVRFDRITQRMEGSSGGRVHAFVEKSTGKLVKPASWKTPAKRSNGELQSQFDLSTPEGFQAAVETADPYGSYLYVNR